MTQLNFKLKNYNKDSFKQMIEKMIVDNKVSDYLKLNWKDNSLTIIIDKGGTSKLFFELIENESNLLIQEDNYREVAFFHKPFIKTVEGKLIEFINQLNNS